MAGNFLSQFSPSFPEFVLPRVYGCRYRLRWVMHDDHDGNIGLFGKSVVKPVQARSVNVTLPQNSRKAIELNQTKRASIKSMVDRLINLPLHITVLNKRLA